MSNEVVKRVRPDTDINRPDMTGFNRSLNQLKQNRVILIGIAVDDSKSIKKFNNKEEVVKVHNTVIESLKKERASEKIIFNTQLFNEQEALNNWVPLAKAKPMKLEKYNTDHETPLYDATVDMLKSAEAGKEAALDACVQSQFGVIIISDGEDTSSKKHRGAEDVKKEVTRIFSNNDLWSPNTLTFMGLPRENTKVNYREIAKSMGIENQEVSKRSEQIMQITTTDKNQRSIRRAFGALFR